MPLLGDFGRSKTYDAKINVSIAKRNQFGKSGLATPEFFHPKHDDLVELRRALKIASIKRNVIETRSISPESRRRQQSFTSSFSRLMIPSLKKMPWANFESVRPLPLSVIEARSFLQQVFASSFPRPIFPTSGHAR
jgi:hypothetical protein